mgnify:CR=1 FL=1|jgi:hypothetical protein
MASWHGPLPKDDGWRQVTLASIAALGQRLWLRCNACGRDLSPEPKIFAAEHGLPLHTPLQIIARRLVCTHCGAGGRLIAGRSRTRSETNSARRGTGGGR